MNIHTFQVTYEQHVQTLIQYAVNSVKAYFDSAVKAINNKANQVGRSTFQNEVMINVQTARIDDPNWSSVATIRRDNIVSKKELKNVANIGRKSGLAYHVWASDVKTASGQVDELTVCVIEWIDEQRTLEDMTVAEIHWWANGSVHNQLNLDWSLEQLYYLMNAKVVDGTRDVVRAEASTDNIRVARARQRVQVYAAGMTQSRRAELQSRRHLSVTWRLSC